MKHKAFKIYLTNDTLVHEETSEQWRKKKNNRRFHVSSYGHDSLKEKNLMMSLICLVRCKK